MQVLGFAVDAIPRGVLLLARHTFTQYRLLNAYTH